MSAAISKEHRPQTAIPSVYGEDGVTIIGMIGVVRESEANRGATLSLFGGGINPGAEVPSGVDPDYILDFARTHEAAGFDMVLTGYSSSTPDGFEIAGYAAAHTQRLGYLIAHRPGFVAPTLAARKAATLDQLTNGRIALHIITGGNDIEQRQDGDWLDHDSRYRRTDEYLDVIRRIWTETDPFDHDGEFYHLQAAYSQARCRQNPHVPLFFGGASEAALDTASRRADLFALWGEPRASIADRIADVRQRVAAAGRDPAEMRFSLSARPILAATEEKAWQRAEEILDRVQRATAGRITPGMPYAAAIRRRLATAPVRGRGECPRRAALDAHRRRQRSLREHHVPGGHPAAGGGRSAGVLRPGMQRVHHSRVRSAGGRRRLRKGTDTPGAGRSRPTPQGRRVRRAGPVARSETGP